VSDVVEGPTVTVLWECRGCGVGRTAALPERTKDEHVLHWMDLVRGFVSAQHRKVSPDCRAPTFDLMIPMRGNPETDPTVRVGEARRQ